MVSAPLSVIPFCSDTKASRANDRAIDDALPETKYGHIKAWGKFLGFTPASVSRHVADAETDEAPEDSIQKIDGRWLRLCDIKNEANRKRVDELANE